MLTISVISYQLSVVSYRRTDFAYMSVHSARQMALLLAEQNFIFNSSIHRLAKSAPMDVNLASRDRC
ncbi:hypothetical protein [Scytonema millei]|uniref:Uncharacterized protein n=1 Tax=Scytonema millei VB511283 TaxID=1245923 RepID=A0A9X5I5D4_9CYAN|nr:hypothetical protein [Scytonema millei]NHC35880.1 hypothetical protein [Scytonema millei VB511283]